MPSPERTLEVEYRPISKLQPYENNARTHSDDQIAQIVASIKEFGWTNPVLVDGENGIIAGHGRIEAARSLGMTDVPVIELDGLTETQKRAYVIADNKLALNAGWDIEALKFELTGLDADGFDLGLTGFDELEMVSFLADRTEGNTDPDAVPEPPAAPTTQLGDIWLLGRHRLRCGDSTAAGDVEALLEGVKPHLMVTDPPYGVEYDPEWRDGADLGVGERSKGKVVNDHRIDWSEAWELFPGDIAYVWHAGIHASAVQHSLSKASLLVRAQVIWAKQHFAMSRGHYHWQHEPCWYAVRKGGKGHWNGDRKQTTLWSFPNNNSFGNADKEKTWGHGTQKPVECMRRPIVNNSSPGQAVYDPFLGSGTTLIAAEMEGRSCYGMEIDPGYCDIIVKRWEEFTGEEAELHSREA